MTHGEIFTYEPKRERPIINEEVCFAVIGLAHIHIYDMCRGLIKAGAKLKYIYDSNRDLVKQFLYAFPNAEVCQNEEKILADDSIRLILSAAIPSERADIAIRSMKAGKDFFVDKAPVISIEQLEAVKQTIDETGRKYFVFYSESVVNEAAIFTNSLLKRGVIGDVFHIESSASHMLNASMRPEWFFEKKYTGGIITDLGSHQIQQFLLFSQSLDVTINGARVLNRNNTIHSHFEDFGDFNLTSKNGVTGYFRMDWYSPKGLKTWGDPRIIIEGSKGYIELRKNCNIGYDKEPNHIFVVTDDGQFHENVSGKVNITFYEDIISDCIFRTETAVDSELQLKAMELSVNAQRIADGTTLINQEKIVTFPMVKHG